MAESTPSGSSRACWARSGKLCQISLCGPGCSRAGWQRRVCRTERRAAPLSEIQVSPPASLPVTGLAPLLAKCVRDLPSSGDVLLRYPSPSTVIARQHGKVKTVAVEDLSKLAGAFDIVVDAGELANAGLVMNLRRYRWDVLGRVEEALQAVAALFQLLRPGGRLLVHIDGEPKEYLANYLAAFPVDVREIPGAGDGSAQVYEFCTRAAVGPKDLQAVLTRELLEERSHRRYADILDAALVGDRLSILDVGGGDGHMAEWWAASGHEISLLEVDRVQAEKAKARLGESRVTFHDGVSKWPYADASFDVCLLLFVLHHIAGLDAVKRTLSEAARVSRRQVLIMEDQPRSAATQGLCQLACAVTAEHFRPFNQDPNVYMAFIRPDEAWRSLFAGAGLHIVDAKVIPGTLQHPVPHTLYSLQPGS